MNNNLKLEILEKISTLVSAGLGLVAALAWNSAIQSLFETLFGKQSSLPAMFAYAIFITCIVVWVTVKLGRLTNSLKERLGKDYDKK